MLNTVHYTLKTTSLQAGRLVNALVTYDVYFDVNRGIAYEVQLQAPPEELSEQLVLMWNARIFNDLGMKRLEYDILQRIYYQTRQTIKVESELYKLQEDLIKFLEADSLDPVDDFELGGRLYPGFKLYTLTIWYDPDTMLPIHRINQEGQNIIIDEFMYHSINTPLPEDVFQLPKPPEAIADFDLYPTAPTLPRFEIVGDADSPEYGVYVETLLEEIKRQIIINQWEYGPFSTIKLPWLTRMPVTIYRRRNSNVFPLLIVVFDVPDMGRSYFFVTYDFLGYVVTGYSDDYFDLSAYEELPIDAVVMLEDYVPLYVAQSPEKQFVIDNFVMSVQSNDFFITAFDMGGKYFDMVIKNFSFHENEGYLLLNVYGKLFWDNANLEAMFNYVSTGSMQDAHVTPILIYQINTIKRMGIYQNVLMPEYAEIPLVEEPPAEV